MRRQELLGPNKMERQQERNKKDEERQELSKKELSKKDGEQEQQVPSMKFQRCAECTKKSDDRLVDPKERTPGGGWKLKQEYSVIQAHKRALGQA
jgi:hypothetical protein